MRPIIIIEPKDEAWLLLKGMLLSIGYKKEHLHRFSTIAEIERYDKRDVEFIITELVLPDSSSDMTFEKLCRLFPWSPIIVLTGKEELEKAITTIKQGAQDYLIKGEIDEKALSKSIQYAIERKHSDNDYKQLFMENPAPMYIFDKENYKFLAANDAALQQYGYAKEDFLKLTALDIRPDDCKHKFVEHINAHRPRYYDAGIWRHKKKDGTEFFVHVHSHQVDFDGKIARMVVAFDVDKAIRTEHALDKKIKEVEHILESMTDAFFTVNTDHELTYVNKEFERIMHLRREQILGRNIWELFPQAVKLKFYEAYYEAINKRINVFFEEYLPGLDLWLSVKAYPVNGGLAVYFIDVTGQRAAQERILQEEQNLRAIINNTNDMIWSTDREYKIISANEAFWQHLHLITGKYKEDLNESDFGREAFSQWAGYFDRAFAGEAYKMIWKDEGVGVPRYAEISFNPIRNEKNEVIGISCFSRDITAEKNLQEKIIADDLNLKAMIDNTEDLIWSIDEHLNLISANQAYINRVKAITGQTPLPGQSIIDKRFSEAAVDEWQGYYSRGLKGERFVIEQELKTGDTIKYSETKFNPILDMSGKVLGVSCFTRDITGPKQYLQRIELQNKELREIAWLQSHKVRNHVATILGLTELIKYNDPSDASNAEILEGVRQSSEQLDKVIREINDKTKLIDD